ncbi:leucine-rich repeat serine/threonine-protein kinase 2 isoform X2 [Nannospalax galili]|uniref:leucine-rich repeat serine/threonine-protein kinase 2 isoform X2 n=1 Tax=Nannospalax galili TaxID=1026970 RepID=UPI00111C1C06|nr:leucine-rich repeat serine/threonine-protein kinase 2 isoform X2 [Nannospalax galili]
MARPAGSRVAPPPRLLRAVRVPVAIAVTVTVGGAGAGQAGAGSGPCGRSRGGGAWGGRGAAAPSAASGAQGAGTGARGAELGWRVPGTMASGLGQGCEEDEEEEGLKKLIVRLNHVQESKQVSTLVQLLEDLLVFTYSDRASKLFEGKNFHVPLLLVLDSYMRVASVQQVGWSLLCKLIEVCPGTMQSLMGPQDVGNDWEVLGVHQLILKMLTVHHANVNLSTVGLKALDLLLNSGKITLLILDEECDIFLLIFDAMHTYSTNDEVQKLGCKALHVLFERVSEEQLIEFVENKDYMVLLRALNSFREEEEIVLHVLHCLHSLAIPCNNVEVLMSGNVRCYNIVVEAMKTFPSSEKIQHVSCCLLHRLTLGNFFNILVLNEVHDFVVKAVRQYPENPSLQISGLSCLALLTETIFLNQDLEERNENQDHSDEEEEEKLFWLEACYRALTQHRKNKHVQEAACWALNNLLMYQNGLHRKIGDEDGQLPVHREVMLSMLMHSSSKDVFQASANALSILLEQNVNFRKILLSKGIYLNVLELMQKHGNSPEVAESGCRMLSHLFEGSTTLDTMAVVLPKIITVMKSHETSLPVQLEALRAIVHFVVTGLPEESKAEFQCKLNMVKKQCFRNDIHKLVLAALNRFIGNPGVQKCGLKVMSSLVHLPEALEVLSLHGAVDTILHTLQMYPDDQEIQCLGLSLMGCLITKKNLCIGTGHLLAKILVSSLQRFKDVAAVQATGLQTVLAILELSVPFAKLLVHHSFDLVIFLQMSSSVMEPKDEQFLNLCCKCFAKLAADDELKNVMLERACDQNNSVMVECLLLLGADANHMKGATSLIYQVCEKENSSKLVELLLNGGCREQDVRKALTVSIRRGDSQVVSLLLRRLALDLANNSICLGGFCMGKIEPSWLGPLFPDKSSNLRKQTNVGSVLARMVLRYQTKSAVEEGASAGDGSFAEDGLLHKLDEWTFLPDSSMDSVFGQSDDLDSEGSESSFLMKRKSNSISVGEFYRDPVLQRCSPNTQRHSNSLGPIFDQEELLRRKRKILSSDDSLRSSKLPSYSRHSGSSSSLTSERDCITSLDLSANELRDIDALSPRCCLSGHLEHLVKLELQQNVLTCFPQHLCETLKCLTHLDLHSNKFTSFPSYLLKMTCITNLDVSRNDIGPSVVLDPTVKCPTLKQLNLSYNQLSLVPENLATAVENLEQLTLEGNKIAGICSSLSLKELKVLNVCKNHISSLPENFLEDCQKVESFSAKMNFLATMPVLPSSITSLKLSQNKFTCIPDVILILPHLRSLDMSNNNIDCLPGPAHWKSLNLRELLFSNNQISILNLSEKPHLWSRVEKLHLSHNKLREIPPEIGFLENLTSLDVSHNSELRSFPNEMGKLSKIWDLPLDELHLSFDFKHVGCKAKDIIRFLQQRLKKAVPYNRMKLMIVGNTGSGKTTLLQQLMKMKKSDLSMQGATVGIDVKDWPIQIRGKKKKDLVLNVWDFAGREEFYSTHPHFMTQRALYLAVYDLSKGQAEVDAMKPWLFNIKARASSSPVILVGTHLDVSDEKQRKACISKITKELLNKRGFPAIRDYHFVNATEESDALAKLRKTIVNESLNFKIRDQPVVGQLIPDCYLELEKIILSERRTVPIEFPVIDQKRLLQLVKGNQLQLDENELPQAVHFLNESGVLLHFQDPALQLSDLYFVEPKWLCKVMAQILTVKVEGCLRHPKGIISRRDVEKFLSKKKRFPKNYMAQYFKLLEKFQIALPIGEECLLVPSSLSDHRPVIELPHCENSEIIIRLYEMPYFPMGFWSRLINRLLEISPFMLSGRERALRPNRMYWRQGIYLNWSPEAYCLVGSEVLDNHTESFLKITVPSCRKGCILLGQVVDHIDSLMEEWFPGLLEIDICGEGETLLKKWALYSFNDGEEHQKILLDDLMKKAEEGDLLVNPDQPRLTIPISQIAPDLILADLPRTIMLNNDELEFEQTPEFLLGDGSFGSVYRATYEGEEVAVKIFNKHTSLRLLRQELVVLCHLHHPSLILLLAAGIRPRMLVMELASKGSLDRLLQQDKASLTRTLQHRIALHVADGLRYLHSAMIIYRDLKPHNVLLFTLYPNAAIIAKIADYGIAQYCCRMGIKTSEGTPGFRAPEVARGNVIYNQQADVYSFGLLLYDIFTTGSRITEGLKFPNEFDELAIQGKLPDPVKEYGCAPWPLAEKLIKKCLKENPQERPTSAQVFDILNSAELICLMRHILIPKNIIVECMVATNLNSKNGSLWLGCGHTDKGQLSFLDLNTEKCSYEEVVDSRILCLALVHLPAEKESWIVCGTQSGALLVINTRDETKRHNLEKMTDSVTCLYCNSFSKQSKQNNFLLVGTADGNLVIFEDKAVKCKGAVPLKTLHIGDVSMPLMCLSESMNSAERNLTWGGCGTKVFSFSSDFTIQKLIETRTSQLFSYAAFSDSSITAVAVDTALYVAKKNSPVVEVWDKKTEKLCELIDTVHFLKEVMVKTNRESKHKLSYSGRVKALCLQKNTALWIGTGGGHILLLDLSTRRVIRIINNFCDSVRVMVPAQLGSLKNVMLVLGYKRKSTEGTEEQKEIQSCLSIWDINLPHEVQNLEKHIDVRTELADKMRRTSVD